MFSQFDNTTIPSDLLDAILNDPDKRQIVLKLLNKTKSTSNDSAKKRQHRHCESPVALFRRRALEKLNGNTSDSSSESSSSIDLAVQPPPKPPPGPKMPHEKLLEGVVAFVDVRRDNVDKSSGIKLVMESMGAVVKDKLTKGVTHVVFKDADFMTYNAARLLKCHLVSVLWLDAIRKKGYRVPEKNYPAFGGDDTNASVLCSQIQKEFDDIINEEKRRSYDVRKINTQTEQKQRRTLITPISSKSSYGTAKSTPKNSSKTDSEIVEILSNIPSTSFVQISSPELTSDDSDCGVVNGYTSSHLREKFNFLETNSSIDTTTNSSEQSQSLINGRKIIKSSGGSVEKNISINGESSDIIKIISTEDSANISPTNHSRSITRSKSKSKTSKLNILSDLILQTPSKITNNNESSDRTKTLSTEKSINVSTSRNSRSISRSNNRSSRARSLRNLSGESSDRTKTLSTEKSINISSTRNRRSSTVRNLQNLTNAIAQTSSINDQSSDRTKTISTEKSMNVSTNKSSTSNKNSTMSPLRISSELNQNDDEIQTTMSSLRVSSNSKDSNKENSELLANRNNNNDINKIKDNQSNVVIKRRRLFDPETIICTPKNDDLEREERKRFLKIRNQHEETNHDVNNVNKPITGKKRKKSINFDKTNSNSNEDLDSPEKFQKTGDRRRSQRLSITPRPISYDCNNRRSSLEFQTSTEKRKKPRTRIDPIKTPSIVCTRFHRNEVAEFIKIVKRLGGFQIEQQVTKKTTHLIAGQSKRTINMLRALARGCWILKREWLHKSLEQGRWLPEEDYELTEFSPVVQQCRLQRQAFGPQYTMDIFESCGKIFVSNNTTPGRDELRELIETCKGDLTNVHRNADIVIGQFIRSPNFICINEVWILDSIIENKLKSIKRYLIAVPESPHY